jgi:hypothetical protein
VLVSLATTPARPDVPNEDFVAAAPDVVVLLDGAGSAGAESGCVHGVAWYARQMGAALLAHATDPSSVPIRDVLRAGTRDVAARHNGLCNLSHPGTPSATVVLVRRRYDVVEYLVLADSVLLIEHMSGEVVAISDDREAAVGARYRATLDAARPGPDHDRALRDYITVMREHRNRRDGFWVASTDEAAADEAIVAKVPTSDVRTLALLSDGASRVADRFAITDWPGIMRTLADQGPAELLNHNRAAEHNDPDGSRWPRGKIHDDATAAYVTAL